MKIKDLHGLSKPACKLIEAVSNAIGTLYQPTQISIVLGLSFLYVCPVRGQDTNKSTVGMSFVGLPATQVLDQYQRMTHLRLLVASNVRLDNQFITLHFTASPNAVPPLLEQAFLKQAGLVITRLDDKRATVTIPDFTNNVTYKVFKHDALTGAPFTAWAYRGADAEVVQAQLLTITNTSSQRICGGLSEAGATTINFLFIKTNGVPYSVDLSGTPFTAFAHNGADAEVIQAQLLTITNTSGQRICGSLSEADATTINFFFVKTNGVPYRVALEVK